MGVEAKQVELGGEKFTIQQFNAKRATRVFVKLSKVAAEPLALAVKLQGLDHDSEEFATILQAIMEKLFSKMDEDEVELLINDLLSCVFPENRGFPLFEVSTGKGDWDTFFQGRPMLLFQVVGMSVKENFADFLSVLAKGSNVAAALKGKLAK